MDKSDKSQRNNETILMALDQISQTIDVMNSVVGRLRTYLQEQEAAAQKKSSKEPVEELAGSDRILH